MSEMVLHRNHTLSTKLGFRIKFEKDKPVWVPPDAVAEAIAIGAEMTDGTTNSAVIEQQENKVKYEDRFGPTDPVARSQAIAEAVDLLVQLNKPTDFLGSGLPMPQAVSRETGFEVSPDEIQKEWFARAEREAQRKEEQVEEPEFPGVEIPQRDDTLEMLKGKVAQMQANLDKAPNNVKGVRTAQLRKAQAELTKYIKQKTKYKK